MAYEFDISCQTISADITGMTFTIDMGTFDPTSLSTAISTETSERIAGDLSLSTAIENIGEFGSLSGLTDVTITNPTNEQVLKYENGIWVNGTGSSGSTDPLLQSRVYAIEGTSQIKLGYNQFFTYASNRSFYNFGGTIWSGNTEIQIGPWANWVGSTFTAYYRDGMGGWTSNTGLTDLDNYYDDGSGVLQTLQDMEYTAWYMFMDANGNYFTYYPQYHSFNVNEIVQSFIKYDLPLTIFGNSIVMFKAVIRKEFTSIYNIALPEQIIGISPNIFYHKIEECINFGTGGNGGQSGQVLTYDSLSETWNGVMPNTNWGILTGNITGQTDLMNELNDKVDVTSPNGRGTFDNSDVYPKITYITGNNHMEINLNSVIKKAVLYVTDGVDTNFLQVGLTNSITDKKIDYLDDYSSLYTDRTLVDKAYVDSLSGGTTSYLDDLLDVEVQGVINGDSLVYNGSTNKWVYQSLGSTLSGAISTETSNRIIVDSSLSTSINTTNSNVTTLSSAISTETSNRISGDSSLTTVISTTNSNVTTLSSAISGEISNRISGDASLSTAIASMGGITNVIILQGGGTNKIYDALAAGTTNTLILIYPGTYTENNSMTIIDLRRIHMMNGAKWVGDVASDKVCLLNNANSKLYITGNGDMPRTSGNAGYFYLTQASSVLYIECLTFPPRGVKSSNCSNITIKTQNLAKSGLDYVLNECAGESLYFEVDNYDFGLMLQSNLSCKNVTIKINNLTVDGQFTYQDYYIAPSIEKFRLIIEQSDTYTFSNINLLGNSFNSNGIKLNAKGSCDIRVYNENGQRNIYLKGSFSKMYFGHPNPYSGVKVYFDGYIDLESAIMDLYDTTAYYYFNDCRISSNQAQTGYIRLYGNQSNIELNNCNFTFPSGSIFNLNTYNMTLTTANESYSNIALSTGTGTITYVNKTPIVNTNIWGSITGTLSNQTDLSTALLNKVNSSTYNTFTGTTNTTLSTKANLNATISSKSTNYTLVEADNGTIIECTDTLTLTLPNGLSTGFKVDVVNMGSSKTITLSASTTLYTKDSDVTIIDQYGGVSIYHKGSNIWLAFGALS